MYATIFNLIVLRLKRRISVFTGKRRFIDNFIILGREKLGQRISEAIRKGQLGLNLVGSFQAETKTDPEAIEGEILATCGKYGVRVIVYDNNGELPVRVRKEARAQGICLIRTADFYERITGRYLISEHSRHTDLPDLVDRRGLAFASRIYSLILGISAFLITLPIYPFIIAGIKLDGKGSAFFVQKRLGKNGKPFELIKFRTMSENSDRENLEIDWMNTAVPEGERPDITRFGKFLRKYKIDEIPQFLALIKGDMNLIGPRPERPKAFQERTNMIPFYEKRLSVKPGITGWAQVHPFKSASEKLQFDLFYFKHHCLLLDMFITLKTLWIMLRRNNESSSSI